MSYTILDLLDKLIMIEQNGRNIYRNIATLQDENMTGFKLVASTLAREEERHIEFYETLKRKMSGQADIQIDFHLYDKASSLVEEFKKRVLSPNFESVHELLKYALNFEKENLALLIDIQGRLVRNDKDHESPNYKVLSKLIKEETNHVKNLEAFVKV